MMAFRENRPLSCPACRIGWTSNTTGKAMRDGKAARSIIKMRDTVNGENKRKKANSHEHVRGRELRSWSAFNA